VFLIYIWSKDSNDIDNRLVHTLSHMQRHYKEYSEELLPAKLSTAAQDSCADTVQGSIADASSRWTLGRLFHMLGKIKKNGLHQINDITYEISNITILIDRQGSYFLMSWLGLKIKKEKRGRSGRTSARRVTRPCTARVGPTQIDMESRKIKKG
jgi:hypothetical protein